MAAEKCIQVMNGRWFDGRQLVAEFYDGFTNYFVEESEEEKAVRDKEWAKWLEGNDNFQEKRQSQKQQPQPDQRQQQDDESFETDSDDNGNDDTDDQPNRMQTTSTNNKKSSKNTTGSDSDSDLVDDWWPSASQGDLAAKEHYVNP